MKQHFQECIVLVVARMNPQAAVQHHASKLVVSEESLPTTALTALSVQSSDRKSDGTIIVFKSSSQFGSLTMQSLETYDVSYFYKFNFYKSIT